MPSCILVTTWSSASLNSSSLWHPHSSRFCPTVRKKDREHKLGLSSKAILVRFIHVGICSWLFIALSWTGESFVGVQALHDFTCQTIRVICYTNHALGEFPEDLINIGIDSQKNPRLGGLPDSAVVHLSVHNLSKEKVFRTRSDWMVVDSTRAFASH